jgi:anti-sigma factor RsiW
VRHPDKWLADYYDHELSTLHSLQIESHIAGCPACQDELASLQKLSRTLSVYQMPDTFASAERFRSRVMLRLPRPEGSGRRLQAWVWWMVPFSLASVLVILLALMALPTVTVWGASVVRWIGLVDPLAALQARGAVPEGMLGDLLSFDLLRLAGIAWQMLLFALLVLVFVPYVGWVGVLVRARQRSDVQKGGTRGPF